jgi:hypothetical protein
MLTLESSPGAGPVAGHSPQTPVASASTAADGVRTATDR